jgi:uncharacterized membrane protein YjdF
MGSCFLTIFVWSGINPKDQFTWFLEVLPSLIGNALFGEICSLLMLSTFHNRQLTQIKSNGV